MAERLNVAKVLDKRKIDDRGRVVVLAEAVGPVSEEKLLSLAQILSDKGVLPVGYRFTFQPLPSSEEMTDSVRLNRSGCFFSEREGLLSMTEAGSSWVKAVLGTNTKAVLADIRRQTDDLVGMSNADLSNACVQALIDRRGA